MLEGIATQTAYSCISRSAHGAARSLVAPEPDSLLYKSELVPCLYATGNPADAARIIEQVLRPPLAIMYARMGDKQVTLQWLATAVDRHVPDVASMRWDPALDLVRNEPKYKALAAKVYGSNGMPR